MLPGRQRAAAPAGQNQTSGKSAAVGGAQELPMAQELPIRMPARKTQSPPTITCSAAETSGVSM